MATHRAIQPRQCICQKLASNCPAIRALSGAAQMPRLTDLTEDAMAYLGSVPVEKLSGGYLPIPKGRLSEASGPFCKAGPGPAA